MRYGAWRGKWRRTQLVEIPKGLVGHYERCAFCSPLEMQTECCRERPTVISSNTPGKPVGLSIVQLRDVDDRIVHQTTSHSPRCIRLTLNLFEPQRWFGRWIGRSEVRDHMYKARMMDSEQNPRLFIVNESVYISIHLHDNAALVEHSKSVHNRTSLSNVVSDRQASLAGSCTRRHDELWERDPRRKGFRRCDDEEEP
jgi:hypothetical protein